MFEVYRPLHGEYIRVGIFETMEQAEDCVFNSGLPSDYLSPWRILTLCL